jgi:phosphoglycerate kinase
VPASRGSGVKEKRGIGSAPLKGRRVLVRVDFNVPLDGHGGVADDRRIAAVLPTLNHLRTAGARSILLSHLGRPGGQRDMAYSLRPVARRLASLLGQTVPLAEDAVGLRALDAVSRLGNGDVVLLENLRFHPGEEANDPAFAVQLAQLGELFVEDAFGVVHRAHASTVGVPRRLPSLAGLLLEKELRSLAPLIDGAEKPYVVLVGGAKVADKLPFLASFLGRADRLAIGGALAFPFLRARGAELGATPAEPGVGPAVDDFLHRAEGSSTEVILPTDLVVERSGAAEATTEPADRLPADAVARDIGPGSRQAFARALEGSRTVFWNGPLGLAEDPRFAPGTIEVLRRLGTIAGYHVAAGGDSARVAEALGLLGSFSYVSTGGGAALEYVQGLELPGLAVLPDA